MSILKDLILFLFFFCTTLAFILLLSTPSFTSPKQRTTWDSVLCLLLDISITVICCTLSCRYMHSPFYTGQCNFQVSRFFPTEVKLSRDVNRYSVCADSFSLLNYIHHDYGLGVGFCSKRSVG